MSYAKNIPEALKGSPSSKIIEVDTSLPQLPSLDSNNQSESMNIEQEASDLRNFFPSANKISTEYHEQTDDWAVIHNDKCEKVLDIDLLRSWNHESVVCSVKFSTDGKYLATGSKNYAQIYNVYTGHLVCKLQHNFSETEKNLYVRSVSFDPEGKILVTGGDTKTIRVWDIETEQIRHCFQGHSQSVYSVDYSRDGKYIASGSGDKTVRIWNAENGQCIHLFNVSEEVTSVAISSDSRHVAAGSIDKTVYIWDISTGVLTNYLKGPDEHEAPVYSVAFMPNDKTLISGSLDKTIKYWEVIHPETDGKCLKTFAGHKDYVLTVSSTPDGNWILSGSKDCGVHFWDAKTSQAKLNLQGHKNSVIAIATSFKGNLFATGGGDCKAKVWRYTSTLK